jgi:hypothetical protein
MSSKEKPRFWLTRGVNPEDSALLSMPARKCQNRIGNDMEDRGSLYYTEPVQAEHSELV